ncbi:ABC transporter ATP-binding protein [Pararhodobacter sp.]|uniref:ABC transporter ATP-binding protein n=1 Tax=Pararhodobacter sp. TaxID=2127056 RepID=UPI002FDDEB57
MTTLTQPDPRAQSQSPALTLDVRSLTVEIGNTGKSVVRDLSFTLAKGSTLALVGESGSGKTMVARSLLNLLPSPLRIAKGTQIHFEGADLCQKPEPALRRIRGARIGMVFQEPMVSLNPSMTVGEQMAEALRLHTRLSRAEIRDRSLAMLERIRIPNPAACLSAYPHEFSGGMRQRIMLASVMLPRPALLIADEPTTALDTLVSREVLDLMIELTQENNTAVLLISHDLGMVARYMRDVVVMKDGSAVESGAASTVLRAPQHAYTCRLVDALPRRKAGGPRRAAGAPLISVRDLVITYPGRQKLFSRTAPTHAVRGVDLTIHEGETLALVGGSGSGKTTLGRALVGLVQPASGQMRFRDAPLDWNAPGPGLRQQIQMVFQDPYSSLDPRQRVGAIVAEPLRLERGLDAATHRNRAAEMLEAVGLDAGFMDRLPHQLSGGQRQRVAIARALVRKPAFVVADEPVSALDMTVQAQILKLIRALQERFGFACLFVSHDLGAVEQVADRVAVMEAGKIVELGARDAIFDAPQHPYTAALLDAAMLIDRRFGDPEAAQ